MARQRTLFEILEDHDIAVRRINATLARVASGAGTSNEYHEFINANGDAGGVVEASTTAGRNFLVLNGGDTPGTPTGGTLELFSDVDSTLPGGVRLWGYDGAAFQNVIRYTQSTDRVEVGAAGIPITEVLSNSLRLSDAAATINFTGTNGGGNAGLQYFDTGGGARYMLWVASDVVRLTNRAADGEVRIFANNSTAGGGGETEIVRTRYNNADSQRYLEFVNPVFIQFSDAGGADNGILFEGTIDDAKRRITYNDGGGNWNFRAGNRFNVSEVYTVTGDGAAMLRMDTDGANGVIYLRVANTGTAGNTVTWGHTMTLNTTRADFDGYVNSDRFEVGSTSNYIIQYGTNAGIAIEAASGTTSIGMGNTSYSHYRTDATLGHWFDKDVIVQGDFIGYTDAAKFMPYRSRTGTYISSTAATDNLGFWLGGDPLYLEKLTYGTGEGFALRISNNPAATESHFEVRSSGQSIRFQVTQQATYPGDSTSATDYAAMMNEDASATNPGFAFSNDFNTGVGWAGADQLSLIAGGVGSMRIYPGTAADDVAVRIPNSQGANILAWTNNPYTDGTGDYTAYWDNDIDGSNVGWGISTTLSSGAAIKKGIKGYDVEGVGAAFLRIPMRSWEYSKAGMKRMGLGRDAKRLRPHGTRHWYVAEEVEAELPWLVGQPEGDPVKRIKDGRPLQVAMIAALHHLNRRVQELEAQLAG